MSTNKSIAKSAGIISLATLCSRLLGFIRDIIIAAFFGTGFTAEAFFVAFRIPNLLRELVGEGAANSAFVPVFCEYRLKAKEEEFWDLTANVLWLAFITLSILSLLGIFFSGFIVSLIAPGFLKTPEKFQLTVHLTQMLFPYLLLIGLVAYGMGVLHTFKSFTMPALGPSVLNICMIIGILFTYRLLPQPIFGLALGVLLGGLLQIMIQIPSLYKVGFRLNLARVKPDFRHPGVKRIGALLIPRFFGAAVYQLNVFIDTILASFSSIVGQGAVAAIYYANRLIQFPLAIFGIALSSAILPVLSTQAAEKDLASLRSTLGFSLRATYFLMLPASLGMVFLSHPLIKVLFERGNFSFYSTQITSFALIFYAAGLVFFGGAKMLIAGFYSLQDTRTPAMVAFFALIVNFILNIMLMFPLKVGGLALASSLASGFNFVLLYLSLTKRIGRIISRDLYNFFLKVTMASLGMAIFVSIFFNKSILYLNPILALLLTIFLAGLVYIGICILLRVKEVGGFLKWIGRI